MCKTLAKSHCVKSVQIQSYLWSVFSSIQTEYGDLDTHAVSFSTKLNLIWTNTSYLDTFHAMSVSTKLNLILIWADTFFGCPWETKYNMDF